MKKLIYVGVLAVALSSVACGGPVEAEEQAQQALPGCTQEPQVLTPGESGAPQTERLLTSSATPCRETNVCEQCSSGFRNKRTYYARQQYAGGVWFCSDLRTEYGSCGSCSL